MLFPLTAALFLILISCLLSTTLAALPIDIDPVIAPKPPLDPPDDIIPSPHGGNDPEGGEPGTNPGIPIQSYPQGLKPPFSDSEPESEDPDWDKLKDQIEDLIESIVEDLIPSSSSSTPAPSARTAPAVAPIITIASNSASRTAPATLPTNVSVNATLACEIYQAYTSLCPAPPTPTTPTTPATHPASSTRASCLCYSSTYYVPVVYDAAASACATYSPNKSAPSSVADRTLIVAASSAALTKNFCSGVGNLRTAPVATFGEFAAATATATSIGPSASTSTPVKSWTMGGYRVEMGMMMGVLLVGIVGVLF